MPEGSSEASTKPFLLQTEQPQLSQPVEWPGVTFLHWWHKALTLLFLKHLGTSQLHQLLLQLGKTLVLVGDSPEAEVGDAGCVLSRLEEFPAPGSLPSPAGWSPAASGNGGTGRGGALQQTQRQGRALWPIVHSSIWQGADPTSPAGAKGKHWLTTSARNAVSSLCGSSPRSLV